MPFRFSFTWSMGRSTPGAEWSGGGSRSDHLDVGVAFGVGVGVAFVVECIEKIVFEIDCEFQFF